MLLYSYPRTSYYGARRYLTKPNGYEEPIEKIWLTISKNAGYDFDIIYEGRLGSHAVDSEMGLSWRRSLLEMAKNARDARNK